MKFLYLTTLLLLLASNSRAQSDIVYSLSGDTIRKCRILEIYDGNMVRYTKKQKNKEVQAAAVYYKKEYRSLSMGNAYLSTEGLKEGAGLYNGNPCSYYRLTLRNANSTKNAGILLTFVGLTSTCLGVITLVGKPGSTSGAALYLGGAVVADLGIALWIYGGIKSANNRKAMKECERKLQLSFGTTHNGIGFRLRI